MTNAPEMLDSGKRREFASGAVRDRGEDKPRPDLISPHANLREGAWLALGAKKYELRNWEAGIPISECIASLERHFLAYQLGKTDEDHMAAIRTNAGFILHYEEEIKAGRLDPTINDMPKYIARDRKYACPKCGHAPLTPFVCETGEELGCDGCHSWTTLDEPMETESRQKKEVAPAPDSLIYKSGPAVESLRKFVADAKAATPQQKAQGYVQRVRTNGTLVGASPGVHYIAGPMRGYDQFNFPAFDAAEKDAVSKGLSVISPAQMDRANGIDPINNPGSAASAETESLNEIIARDCETLVALSTEAQDGMILLPGWEDSTGARAEVSIGLWLKLQFRFAEDLNMVVPAAVIRNRLFYQQEDL